MKRRDIIEFEVDKMEFGGTSVSLLGNREIHMKGGITGQKVKASVKKTAITMCQYPEGVDFGEEKAQLVFGIAGIGDEHLDLLGKIATIDPEKLEQMKTTTDIEWVMETLA